MVAREDGDGAGAVDHPARGEDRGARPLPVGLLGHLEAAVEALRNALARASNADDAVRAGLLGGGGHPQHHRPAANRMQHLRKRGAHPGPMAGRHDQDGQVAGHLGSSVPAAGFCGS